MTEGRQDFAYQRGQHVVVVWRGHIHRHRLQKQHKYARTLTYTFVRSALIGTSFIRRRLVT